MLYWLLLLAFSHMFLKKKFNFFTSFLRIGLNSVLFKFLVVSIVLVVFAIVIYYRGSLKIKIDLSDIYINRLEVRAMNLPYMINSFISFSSRIIPITTTFFIFRKNLILVTFLVVAQLALYELGAHKTMFFMIMLALCSGVIYRKEMRNWVYRALILLNTLCVILFTVEPSEILIQALSLLHRRTMFVPPFLSYQYYRYFKIHELDVLRSGIGYKLFGIKSPYFPLGIAKTLGYALFGSKTTSANNGLIGDAYANFGWFGAFIYPLLFAFFFKFINSSEKRLPESTKALVSLTIVVAIINSSFMTVMMSHGLLVISVFLIFFPKDNARFQAKKTPDRKNNAVPVVFRINC
jgi:hypothetical protein